MAVNAFFRKISVVGEAAKCVGVWFTGAISGPAFLLGYEPSAMIMLGAFVSHCQFYVCFCLDDIVENGVVR